MLEERTSSPADRFVKSFSLHQTDSLIVVPVLDCVSVALPEHLDQPMGRAARYVNKSLYSDADSFADAADRKRYLPG